MGLESQLLGAHACGIRNVLAVTGDPPEVGDYPGSRGVYEIDSIGLTQLMARLNRGEDYNGRSIDAATPAKKNSGMIWNTHANSWNTGDAVSRLLQMRMPSRRFGCRRVLPEGCDSGGGTTTV